jgi:hypothetical protein
VNLDWLTCILKFEVLLQVANRTKKENSKESNLNLNPLDLGFYYSKHFRGTVDTIVATIVTPGVLQELEHC